MSAPKASFLRSKFLQLGVGLAVSVACLWWAVADMLKDPNAWPQIVAAFRKADYSVLIPVWIGLFVFYWLKAWRWKLLLAPLGDFRPMKELFPPIVIGFAFNNLLPAHLGEFVRVFVFGRTHKVPKTAVLSTVVLERVFDVLAIVAFLGAGLMFVPGVNPDVKKYGLIGGAAAFLLVLGSLAFVIWTKPVLTLVEAVLKRTPFVPERLVSKLSGILESAADGLTSLRSPRLLTGILVTSLLQWAINGWMMHLSLASFGIPVSIWVSCILLGAVAFAVTIPSSPGYFGVIQLTFMGVLKLFTQDQEGVFAASIFYHLAQYVPVTLLGLYFFNRTGLKVSQVQHAAEDEVPPPLATEVVLPVDAPLECLHKSAGFQPAEDVDRANIEEKSVTERVIIIGSGPAGWAAAIYAARAQLNPLVFEGAITQENNDKGTLPLGQLNLTTEVENYPGFPAGNIVPYLESALPAERRAMMPDHLGHGVSGPELMFLMRQQAENCGARIVTDDVIDLDCSKRPFVIKTLDGETHSAHAVIIATGARANYLGLPSEERFKNRGVSACAVCDGALPRFREKPLVVVGGGDSAMEEATYLTKFGSKVYIVHRRDEFRASKVMAERVLANPKITVKWNSAVSEVLGDDDRGVTGVKLTSTTGGAAETLEAGGYFAAIGHTPNTDFLKGQLKLTDKKYIVWTKPFRTFTSVEGVFAAGDVADDYYRQAITAAGSGCQAALDCERWLAAEGVH